jgi:hypothetical protein
MRRVDPGTSGARGTLVPGGPQARMGTIMDPVDEARRQA